MRHETFSNEYQGYRIRQAMEIAGNLRPYLYDAVSGQEQAQLFPGSKTHALVERLDGGVRLSFATSYAEYDYQGLHEFTFGADGNISYFLGPGVDAELPKPRMLGSIEDIGRDEGALYELAFISKMFIQSALAENHAYNYYKIREL